MSTRSIPAIAALALLAALALAGCAGTPSVSTPADAAADAEYRPNAPYPADSIQNKEQGVVVVRVLTGPDGRPREARLQQSSNFGRLDRAALDTVMRWRFRPTPGSEPVWREVPFTFGIVGSGPAL